MFNPRPYGRFGARRESVKTVAVALFVVHCFGYLYVMV